MFSYILKELLYNLKIFPQEIPGLDEWHDEIYQIFKENIF